MGVDLVLLGGTEPSTAEWRMNHIIHEGTVWTRWLLAGDDLHTVGTRYNHVDAGGVMGQSIRWRDSCVGTLCRSSQ